MTPKEKQSKINTISLNFFLTIAPKQQFLFELHHKFWHIKIKEDKSKQTKEEKDFLIKGPIHPLPHVRRNSSNPKKEKN
jgi:hypothetical protein